MRRTMYKLKRDYAEVLLKEQRYDPKVFWGLILPFCLIFVCLILFSGETKPVWTFFADTMDYMHQSKFSLFSAEFWAPTAHKWFNPRPFTFPLFYKFVGSDPFRMIFFQKLIYCTCIGFFIYTLVKMLPKIILLRAIFVVYFLFFFTWWNIFGWSTNLLSEFLSLCFLFLWIAMVINYLLKPSLRNTLILLVVSFFFSFTRDNWMYFILAFFVANFALAFLYLKDRRLHAAIGLGVYLLVFWLQSNTIYTTKRYTLPVFNSIALRISQNPSYLRWFKDQGMPHCEFLKKEFHDAYNDTSQVKQFMYRAYEDTANTRVLNWIKKEGKSTFTKFILEHPSFVFMFDQNTTQTDRIYAYDLRDYCVAPESFFKCANFMMPIFNNWYWFLLLASCGLIWYRYKEKIFLLPFLFTGLTIVNIFVSYNADALDVERHLFATAILRELTCILCIMLMIIKWFALKKAKREEELR
jgi:hypothetical protein